MSRLRVILAILLLIILVVIGIILPSLWKSGKNTSKNKQIWQALTGKTQRPMKR